MTEGKITPLKNNIASNEKINFTLNELIDVFGASRPTLLRLTHMEGGLPHFYIGKKILYPRQALIEWVNLRAQEGAVL